MVKKYKRRQYFIHPSSQIKYMALSVLPTLIMSLFCIFFLLNSGELILRAAKEKPAVPFYSIRQIIHTLEKQGYTENNLAEIASLKRELHTLKNILEASYVDTLQQWKRTKRVMYAALLCVLMGVWFLSLLYSHRIAGPLFRMRMYMDMLSEGKDVPPIQFRKHDEFKELAESLDKLKNNLKSRGFLGTES